MDPDPAQAAQRAFADSVRARLRVAATAAGDTDDRALRSGSKSLALPAPASAMPSPTGLGNQNQAPLGRYVQALVRKEFFPVAGSCYENTLESQPDAGGTISLDVSVVGDQSVGGVVDSVEVNPASTISDHEFITCLRESMYALAFAAPPPGATRVTFTYPFNFSPSAPDAGSDH